MNLCTPQQIQSAAVLSPTMVLNGGYREGFSNLTRRVPQAIVEVFQCLGPIIVINHPDSFVTKSTNNLIVIKAVLAGVGEEVSEPFSAKSADNKVHYKRIGGRVALARQQNLRQCAQLPADPPPMPGASVMLVNRPHGGGRHIVGLDDVYDQLLRTLTPHGIPVRLVVPRVESLASQAAMFGSSNVIVVPHGAANTNFAFVPHRTIIFGVHAIGHRFALDMDHSEALPSPPYNITLIPVKCANNIQVDNTKISSIPKFDTLTPEERSYLLNSPELGPRKIKILKKLGINEKDWMKFADYAPNTTSLAIQVANAAIELDAYLKKS